MSTISFARVLAMVLLSALLGGCDMIDWLLVDKDSPAEVRQFIADHPGADQLDEAEAALAVANFTATPNRETALDLMLREALEQRYNGPVFNKAKAFIADSLAASDDACDLADTAVALDIDDGFKKVDVAEALDLDRWLTWAGLTRRDDAANRLGLTIRGHAKATRYDKVGALYTTALVEGSLDWDIATDDPARRVQGRDTFMGNPSADFLISINTGGIGGFTKKDLEKRRRPSPIALRSGMGEANFSGFLCQRLLDVCPTRDLLEVCSGQFKNPHSRLSRRPPRVSEAAIHHLGLNLMDSRYGNTNLFHAFESLASPIATKYLLIRSNWHAPAIEVLTRMRAESVMQVVRRRIGEATNRNLMAMAAAIPHFDAPPRLIEDVEAACGGQTVSDIAAACNAAIQSLRNRPADGKLNRARAAERHGTPVKVGPIEGDLGPGWTRADKDFESLLRDSTAKSLVAQLRQRGRKIRAFEIKSLNAFRYDGCDCRLVVQSAQVEVDQSLDNLLIQVRANALYAVSRNQAPRLIEFGPVTVGTAKGVLTELENHARGISLGILLNDQSSHENLVQVTLIEKKKSGASYERARRDVMALLGLD